MVIGGSGNDTINASAFTATAQLTLEGGAGMDSMFGGQAADSIVGGDGHDVVIGKDGNDFLVGGEGDDHLVGSDLYNPYENTQIDTLTGGEGNDVFYFWNTMDSTLSYSKFEMNDYALITDFEIGKDLISFGGYTPEINNLLPSGITTGEAIYNGTELVAVVQLKTGTGSLSSSDFI
jgi:Ca2+-binding RTX toxin-like protein